RDPIQTCGARMVLPHAGERRNSCDALGAADEQDVWMAIGRRLQRRPFVARRRVAPQYLSRCQVRYYELNESGRLVLRSSLLLRPAGGARDEVLRSCGEKLELRTLQWAQRRCEAGIDEPFAQQANRGLVLGSAAACCFNFQAGIAEEAMNDF